MVRKILNITFMKKFISLAKLCVALLAGIGGIGYALYSQAYVIAIAVALLVWLAWPSINEAWKDLNS